jgi:hypothetical protein
LSDCQSGRLGLGRWNRTTSHTNLQVSTIQAATRRPGVRNEVSRRCRIRLRPQWPCACRRAIEAGERSDHPVLGRPADSFGN